MVEKPEGTAAGGHLVDAPEGQALMGLTGLQVLLQLQNLGTKLDRTDAKIDDLRSDMDSRFRETDAKIETLRRETDAKIDALRKETEVRSRETDAKIETMRKETEARSRETDTKAQSWAIGTIVAIVLCSLGIIVAVLMTRPVG